MRTESFKIGQQLHRLRQRPRRLVSAVPVSGEPVRQGCGVARSGRRQIAQHLGDQARQILLSQRQRHRVQLRVLALRLGTSRGCAFSPSADGCSWARSRQRRAWGRLTSATPRRHSVKATPSAHSVSTRPRLSPGAPFSAAVERLGRRARRGDKRAIRLRRWGRVCRQQTLIQFALTAAENIAGGACAGRGADAAGEEAGRLNRFSPAEARFSTPRAPSSRAAPGLAGVGSS